MSETNCMLVRVGGVFALGQGDRKTSAAVRTSCGATVEALGAWVVGLARLAALGVRDAITSGAASRDQVKPKSKNAANGIFLMTSALAIGSFAMLVYGNASV
jgi:hypothetical protein